MSDRYEIREKLGQGGLGAVFKAYDKQLRREVALKRVITPTQEAVDDLLREATTLSSLMHPNIVTVFDVGQDEEGGFVVMELLDGETLDDTISRAPLTLPDFAEVVNQTLEALIAAQAVNMTHRDLKPSNIMVIWRPSGRFQIKVLDFGLARINAAPKPQTSDQEEGIMGSIYFMAPEQFERATLDFRTDMYAMGCIYYYCLTGMYPFDGDTAPQVMMAHLHHLVRPLEVVRPDIPEEVADWVMSLMERNREDRPGTAREALDRFPDLTRPTPVISGTIPRDGTVVASPAPSLDEIVSAYAVEEAASAGSRTHALSPAGPKPPGSRAGALRSSVKPKAGHRDKHSKAASKASEPVAIAVALDEDAPEVDAFQAAKRKKLLILLASCVGGLALLVIGTVFALGKMQAAKEAARIELLEKNPAGQGTDVSILVRHIAKGSKEEGARLSGILKKLNGAGVDDAIREELAKAPPGPASVALLDVVENRRLPGCLGTVLGIYGRSTLPEERAKAMSAISKLAGPGDVGALLGLLKIPNMDAAERKRVEDGVASILYLGDRVIARGQPVLDLLPNSTGDQRRSLARIAGILGGGEAVLNRFLMKLLSTEEQIFALSHWPDRSGKDVLESIMTGRGEASKHAAARAYIRMLRLPTSSPDDNAGYQLVLDSADRKDVGKLFEVMVENPSAQTLKFCRETKIPDLQVQLKDTGDKVEKAAKEAVVIKSGQLVPAAKATIFGGDDDGTAYDKDKQAEHIHWKSPRSWMSWVVRVEAPGTYEVSVIGSCPDNQGSDVKVTFIGEPLQTKTVKTPKDKTSEALTLGEVKVDPPQQGVRRLFLSVGEVAQPDGIMKVKGIRFTKK